MAKNILELHCGCGKLIRVPQWRTGQVGKCNHCEQMLAIPSVYDPAIWENPMPLPEPVQNAPKKEMFPCPHCGAETPRKESKCHVCSASFASASPTRNSFLSTAFSLLLTGAFMMFTGIFLGVLLGPTYLGILHDRLIPQAWLQKIERHVPQEVRDIFAAYKSEPGPVAILPDPDPVMKPKDPPPKQTPETVPVGQTPRLPPPGQQKMLGPWYVALYRSGRQIESQIDEIEKSPSPQDQKAIKAVGPYLKKIKTYANEIKKVYTDLYREEEKGKNFHLWAQKRGEQVKGNSEKEKALELLKKFAETGILPVEIGKNDEEMATLAKELEKAGSPAARYKVFGNIFKNLKEIDSIFEQTSKTLEEPVKEFVSKGL